MVTLVALVAEASVLAARGATSCRAYRIQGEVNYTFPLKLFRTSKSKAGLCDNTVIEGDIDIDVALLQN